MIPNLEGLKDATISLVLIAGKQEGVWQLRKLNLSQALADSFRMIAAESLLNLNEREAVPYRPELLPAPNHYLELHLTESLPFKDVLEGVTRLSNIELYGADEPKFLKQLSAYALVIQLENEPIVLFREFKNSKVLSLTKGLSAIFSRSSDSFQKLEDSVFRFDELIDCVYYQNSMRIINVNAFIRMFEYYHHMEEKAEQALGVIAEQLPIANFTEFAETCRKDRRMQQKLTSIVSQDYFASLDFNKVQQVISRHQLDLPVKQSETGDLSLEFNATPQQRWLILKVLDDDYLESPMTSLQYEANSKVRLHRKKE